MYVLYLSPLLIRYTQKAEVHCLIYRLKSVEDFSFIYCEFYTIDLINKLSFIKP